MYADLQAGPLGQRYHQETALHHHVSRKKMSEVASSFDEARKSSTRKAAGQFKMLVMRIMQQVYKQADMEFETALHNLPFNLHYGPVRVQGNPGHAFDPTTEPAGNGERAEAAVSSKLRQFQDVYDAAFDLEGEELSNEAWLELTTLLDEAYVAWGGKRGQIETSEEQWLEADAGENIWVKKGNLSLIDDEVAALDRFNSIFYRGPVAEGSGAPEVEYVHTFPLSDGPVDVYFFATGERIDHFCNRHTHKHFDFDQIKGVNIFWPKRFDRAAAVAEVAAGLQSIAETIEGFLPNPGEQDFGRFSTGFDGLLEKNGLKTTAVNGLNYFAATLADFPDTAPIDAVYAVSIELFAPTGPAYEAFAAETLTAISDSVYRNGV